MIASGFFVDDVPELDPTGRTYLIFVSGTCETARHAARRWASDAAALGRDVEIVDDPTPEHAGSAVAGLRAGSRILIAGPASEAMALTAAARRAGAFLCELTTYITSTTTVTVFCPHCDGTQRVDAEPGALVTCTSCGLELEIRPHLSSHHGAYLGATTGHLPTGKDSL